LREALVTIAELRQQLLHALILLRGWERLYPIDEPPAPTRTADKRW
jgi:hypothetical protein